MKNIMKKYVSIILVAMMLVTNAVPALAYEDKQEASVPHFNIEISNDPLLDGAKLISEDTVLGSFSSTTTSKYMLEDGTEVIDTLVVPFCKTKSKNGTGSATRTRQVGQLGSISLTASFKWYTEGLFSYVKCTSAYANYDTSNSSITCKYSVTKTDNYVKIGKANAKVGYSFTSGATSGLGYSSGNFKITCTDSGTISDNA